MRKNRYKAILLTGASGQLGRAIFESGVSCRFLNPKRNELEITNSTSVANFFKKNDFDVIIHCAAIANMAECEKNPAEAIDANIIGTCNLVKAVISIENKLNKNIRFVHISTDGVYPGKRGGYSECDETIPYNNYGWTKLGAECAVNLLKNFCIIRTSFFNPEKIKFHNYAIDRYSSKVGIDYLAISVLSMVDNPYVGTINIGGRRQSDYDIYRKYSNFVRPCKIRNISKNTVFGIAKDSSMDVRQWKKMEKKVLKNI